MKLNFLEMTTKVSKIALSFLVAANLYANVKISNAAVTNTKYIAVIGDLNTCTEILEELNLYIKSVSNIGYGTFLLCEQWKNAAHVKKEINKLYFEKHIEGAILFGNIPKVKLSMALQKTANLASSFETNYFYENFNSNFSYVSKDAKYEYYFLNSKVNEVERKIYISRIPDGYNNDKKIGEFFARLSEFHTGDYYQPVKKVVGIIGKNFMGGSSCAVKSDSDILKETIDYFYNDKQASVSYLKYNTNEALDWNKKESNLGFLFFQGSKNEYLKNSKADLVILTGLKQGDEENILNGKQYAALSFPESIRNENLFPPFYYMFFAGHRVGGYYRNLKKPQVMLYGDPLFLFTKGEKLVFETGQETRILRLITLKRLMEQNQNISSNIIEKLLNDKDEKIRYEVFNWIKHNASKEMINYADKLMLDSSDRIFRFFIESMVSTKDVRVIPLLRKNREYFNSQGDSIRTGILDKGLKLLSTNITGKES